MECDISEKKSSVTRISRQYQSSSTILIGQCIKGGTDFEGTECLKTGGIVMGYIVTFFSNPNWCSIKGGTVKRYVLQQLCRHTDTQRNEPGRCFSPRQA